MWHSPTFSLPSLPLSLSALRLFPDGPRLIASPAETADKFFQDLTHAFSSCFTCFIVPLFCVYYTMKPCYNEQAIPKKRKAIFIYGTSFLLLSDRDQCSRICADGHWQIQGKTASVADPGEDFIPVRTTCRRRRSHYRHVLFPSQDPSLVLCDRHANDLNRRSCYLFVFYPLNRLKKAVVSIIIITKNT